MSEESELVQVVKFFQFSKFFPNFFLHFIAFYGTIQSILRYFWLYVVLIFLTF